MNNIFIQKGKKLHWLTVWVPLVVQFISWPFLRLFFKVFMHMEVRGLENIKDAPKASIFAPNHASELDSWVVRAGLPWFSRWSPMFYVTAPIRVFRESVYHIKGAFGKIYTSKYVRYIFALWGAHPLGDARQDYAMALHRHRKVLNAGYPVCLYPEGSMTKDGKLQKARGGVAYLSVATAAPVIPVYISGTYNIRISHLLRRRYNVTITYGKPKYMRDIKVLVKDRNMADIYSEKAQVIMDSIRKLSIVL